MTKQKKPSKRNAFRTPEGLRRLAKKTRLRYLETSSGIYVFPFMDGDRAWQVFLRYDRQVKALHIFSSPLRQPQMNTHTQDEYEWMLDQNLRNVIGTFSRDLQGTVRVVATLPTVLGASISPKATSRYINAVANLAGEYLVRIPKKTGGNGTEKTEEPQTPAS